MKHVKMVLYGEPGVGKSVFACHAPKPFFICTDGNYEWLEDAGADPDAHANVTSWAQIKSLLARKDIYDNYKTIVLDLTEDAFMWCESEYCLRNNIEHVSDLGFAKGYHATRNEFFIEISKLFAQQNHVILIMHGITYTVKDRRGVEHTKYAPTSRIPDKVLDMIEGRVRYFLRAYVKDEEQSDGTVVKRRWLSLVPKPNEFGIIRGVDETKIPQDIELNWDVFARTLALDDAKATAPEKIVEKKADVKKEEIKETKKAERPQEKAKKIDEPQSDPIPSVVTPPPVTQSAMSNEERIAAIKAKLAAINAGK